MRAKVLAVLADFSEGLTIRASLKKHQLTWRMYYKEMGADPSLRQQYLDTRRNRAEMAADRLAELTDALLKPEYTDENGALVKPPDARNAHVAGNLLIKIMETHDPDQFSPKMQHTIEQKPSLIEAIEVHRRYASLPSRDPANIIEGQYAVIPSVLPSCGTDMKSGDDAGDVDPFS